MSRYIFIIVIFFYSCSNKQPNDILTTEELNAVMQEMGEAEAFVTNYVMKDSTKNHKQETFKLYNKVFALHHTNSKQVLNSFDYYLKNPMQMKVLLDSIQTKSRKLNVLSPKAL
jgi:DeoR/GlpR family transcriptional regulator of sugar metabolism